MVKQALPSQPPYLHFLGAVPLCVMAKPGRICSTLQHPGLSWASLHPAEHFLHRALKEFLHFPYGLLKIQDFQESNPSTLCSVGEHTQQMCNVVVPLYPALPGAPPWLWTHLQEWWIYPAQATFPFLSESWYFSCWNRGRPHPLLLLLRQGADSGDIQRPQGEWRTVNKDSRNCSVQKCNSFFAHIYLQQKKPKLLLY